jgi:hypothetical protein
MKELEMVSVHGSGKQTGRTMEFQGKIVAHVLVRQNCAGSGGLAGRTVAF